MRAVDRTHLLLTGSINGSVKLWDIEHGVLVHDMDGFHDGVLCLDFYQLRASPVDGKGKPTFLAVGGSGDCTAKVCSISIQHHGSSLMKA
jgi:WD40 repeat protein